MLQAITNTSRRSRGTTLQRLHYQVHITIVPYR